MSQTFVILVLACASLLGTGLIAYAILRSQRRDAALQALCAEKGWRYEKEKISSGYGSITTISDPNADWLLRIKFISGGNSTGGSGGTRLSEWILPSGGLSEGLAVLGPTMGDPAQAKGVERMMQMMGGRMGELLMSKLFGPMGADMARLRAVDLPATYGVMLATPGQEDALLGIARHEGMTSALGNLRGAVPVIMRSPEGLSFRLRKTVGRAEEVEAMVAAGHAIQALSDEA